MLKISLQVHIPYHVLINRLEDILEEGINPEIYLDGEWLDGVNPSRFEEIRKRLLERGLTITLHGPYVHLNPGSMDESIRLRTVEKYRRIFDIAGYLKPRTVVLHGGYDEKRFRGEKDRWLEQSLRTWDEFVKRAEELQTVIAVENVFERKPDTLRTLVESIDSPYFRCCLDSGHINIFSRVPLEEWFEEIGEFTEEVHLHDNNGTNDDHLPVGDGSIDFPLFFDLLREHTNDPIYTIEIHGEEVLFRGLRAVERFLSDRG